MIVYCSTGSAVDIDEPSSPLTYYGGYFNVTRHWQNRVTTEYTNLTRINGDYESHLTPERVAVPHAESANTV